MKDPFSRYVETATQVTRDTAEKIVRSLLKQGNAATANDQSLVDDLRERSQVSREGLADLVRTETKRVIAAMGLATRDDIERLEQQIAALRQRMSGEETAARAQAVTPSGTREVAKKTAARRTAKKANSGDAPLAVTTGSEAARRVATAPEAKSTAAELTRPPGEAAGSGESPAVAEPPEIDAETHEREGEG